MKKLLLSGLCAVLSAAATAQNIMVVEQKSGTTTEFSVDDIQRVYFKNDGGTDVNPSNAVLSSRLKDKDGNPVLLDGIKSENEGWHIKCEYDNKGVLTSYISDGFSCNVNGLSIESTDYEYYSLSIELNTDGLISNLSVCNEHKNRKMFGNISFLYDNNKHLIQQETTDAYGEVYDESGNLVDINYYDNEIINYEWDAGDFLKPAQDWITYGNDINICMQNLCCNNPFEGPLEALWMLGLFGVGSAHFPIFHNYTYTLNPNGTIATEKGMTYTYK